MTIQETWYLLYDGQSCDGAGKGEYCGRTTNKDEAIEHWIKVHESPYNIGRVVVVTDKRMFVAWYRKDIG